MDNLAYHDTYALLDTSENQLFPQVMRVLDLEQFLLHASYMGMKETVIAEWEPAIQRHVYVRVIWPEQYKPIFQAPKGKFPLDFRHRLLQSTIREIKNGEWK